MKQQTKINPTRLTLNECWKTLSTEQRDKLKSDIAEETGKSIDTVKTWMLGYRLPSSKLEKEAVERYILNLFNVIIIYRQ